MSSVLFSFTLIVLVAHITEAFSGFGSTILSIALGANFYPVETLVCALVPLNVPLSCYLVFRYHEHVDAPLLAKKIFPFMGSGFVVGMVLFHALHGDWLKKFFGIFILCVSAREILNGLKKNPDITSASRLTPSACFGIFSAGVLHGLYASGGPLLVYALSRLQMDKKVFRSTLSAVWLALNVILTASLLFTGKINRDTLTMSAFLFPTLPLGIIIGEILHRRIRERTFRLFIFCILLIAGISLVLSSFTRGFAFSRFIG